MKSGRMRLAVLLARMRQKISAYTFSVERPEEKRPLGRHERRWEDNIKMDFSRI
jgi:hypothetical protein